jgi:hypothetical protein
MDAMLQLAGPSGRFGEKHMSRNIQIRNQNFTIQQRYAPSNSQRACKAILKRVDVNFLCYSFRIPHSFCSFFFPFLQAFLFVSKN